MTTTDHEWLTPSEAAEILKLSIGTLANWRSLGTGPEFAKQGRIIRYTREALDAFMGGR